MDYVNKFNNRIKSFIDATNTYPHCMEHELITAVNELDIHDNEIIVNLAAGGLPIDRYISKPITYLPFDFSEEWCTYDNHIIHTTYKKIPLENESVDKIIVLAVLHHFTEEERSALYKECHRILKKSGKLVIADVIKNSPQDKWLNTIVHHYNPFGHHGRFFDSNDATLIELNQYDVQIKHNKYYWQFTNQEEMCTYFKKLFYLTISNNTLMDHVHEILTPIIEQKYNIEWELIYFIATPLDP